MGPFGACNFWRYWRILTPSYPNKLDREYTEVKFTPEAFGICCSLFRDNLEHRARPEKGNSCALHQMPIHHHHGEQLHWLPTKQRLQPSHRSCKTTTMSNQPTTLYLHVKRERQGSCYCKKLERTLFASAAFWLLSACRSRRERDSGGRR